MRFSIDRCRGRVYAYARRYRIMIAHDARPVLRPFALFVVAVLAVYHCLGRRAQNWWLLLCSYVFYGLVGRQLPVVLLVVTLGNYLLARSIRAAGPTAGRWFWGAVAADVLTLALL